MSTTFEILRVPINNRLAHIIDLTEQSSKFYLSIDRIDGDGEYVVDGDIDLNPVDEDAIIKAALRMLQVVFYSYPEKHNEVKAQLDGLAY